MSIKTYQKMQDQVTDARRNEIMAFQRCNALMIAASEARARAQDPARPLEAVQRATEALFKNDQLWMALIADLASEANQLPDALRARLISLGLWVHRYADQVRFKNAPFAPLIALNGQMIEGLSASLSASFSAEAPVAQSASPLTLAQPISA